MVHRISILLIFLFSVSTVRADVLFEGYSKVTSGGVHVGYVVNRYEFDNKKKQFISTSFLKTNESAGGLTESIQAYATEDLKPLSYSYTTLVGTNSKTIDAKFEKGKMIATVMNSGKLEKISKEIPKGTFLSTFLTYVMLKSPQGLKPDTKYDYQSIAEEDAGLVKGVAFVKGYEDFNGQKALKVLNEFKDSKWIAFVNDKGEVLSTRSPVQGIATELVVTPNIATAGMQIPTSLLKKLFGEVPTGQKNELSASFKSETAPAAGKNSTAPAVNVPGKQEGIPGGKGIHLKGQPEKQSPDKSQAETPAGE